MGFFDKIKGFFKRLKEENKYFARTTARINSSNLYLPPVRTRDCTGLPWS